MNRTKDLGGTSILQKAAGLTRSFSSLFLVAEAKIWGSESLDLSVCHSVDPPVGIQFSSLRYLGNMPDCQ